MQCRKPLADGVPLVTIRKRHLRSEAPELPLFLSGDTGIRHRKENGVSIWNEWADADGDLGPVRGPPWRRFPHVTQAPTDDGEARPILRETGWFFVRVEASCNAPDRSRLEVAASNPASRSDWRCRPVPRRCGCGS